MQQNLSGACTRPCSKKKNDAGISTQKSGLRCVIVWAATTSFSDFYPFSLEYKASAEAHVALVN
jgi:hypothetical protein